MSNLPNKSYHQIILPRHIFCAFLTHQGHQSSNDPDSDRSLSPKRPSTLYEVHPAPNLLILSCHRTVQHFLFSCSIFNTQRTGFTLASTVWQPSLAAISQSASLWASMTRFIKNSRRLAKPLTVSQNTYCIAFISIV